MVEFGIDEVTIVCSLNELSKGWLIHSSWKDLAEELIVKIEKILDIKNIFGNKEIDAVRPVAGYQIAYKFGNHPFLFQIAYHTSYNIMGVVIKYSAKALNFYLTEKRRLLGLDYHVFHLVQELTNKLNNYRVRISRIDIYCDFFDENFDLDNMYEKLTNGEYKIKFSKGRVNQSKISCINKSGYVETIYIGSRKKGKKSFVRIYNKRAEQINSRGIRYKEALACRSWIRLENSILNSYAHAVNEKILEINDIDELCSLIGNLLLNKYSVTHSASGKLVEPFKIIEDSITEGDFYFTENKYKDLSLRSSYDYLLNGSGLSSFLYKLREIDETKIDVFFASVKNHLLKRYRPTVDVEKWLKSHKEYYKKEGIDFMI